MNRSTFLQKKTRLIILHVKPLRIMKVTVAPACRKSKKKKSELYGLQLLLLSSNIFELQALKEQYVTLMYSFSNSY